MLAAAANATNATATATANANANANAIALLSANAASRAQSSGNASAANATDANASTLPLDAAYYCARAMEQPLHSCMAESLASVAAPPPPSTAPSPVVSAGGGTVTLRLTAAGDAYSYDSAEKSRVAAAVAALLPGVLAPTPWLGSVPSS